MFSCGTGGIRTIGATILLDIDFQRSAVRASFLPAFAKFPDEAATIGRLLAGYSKLEVSLLNCVHIIRNDFDTVFKAMFRVRGETQRIDIADAFGRQFYRRHHLGTQFETAVSSVRYCLNIRNQYAHCVWHEDHSGKLAFTNLEEIAEKHEFAKDLAALNIFYVDAPLLQAQEDYFSYADALLGWVNFEGRRWAGRISIPAMPAPRQMMPPPLRLP
jgi:hypothetical protein